MKEFNTGSSVQQEYEFGKINQFLSQLHYHSKCIIWHMLIHKHAQIGELTQSINAENDSVTLIKIREIINPLAQRILGQPFMLFKEAQVEPAENKKILFSWWLNSNIKGIQNQNAELIEVIDHDEQLRITMELPEVKTEELTVQLQDSTLTVLQSGKEGVQKNIPLYYSIKRIIQKNYKNNVLEIILEKSNSGYSGKEQWG